MLNTHQEFPFEVGQQHQGDSDLYSAGYRIAFPDHQTPKLHVNIHF